MKLLLQTSPILILLLIAAPTTLSACPYCRTQVEAGIYNPDFGAHVFAMLLPLFILMALGVSFYFADDFINRAKKEIITCRATSNTGH